jgi:hypothetical protein
MNLLRPCALSACALLSACAAISGAPSGYPPAKAQAYAGAPRPEAEVATVFIVDGRPHYEAGFICGVDGNHGFANGRCASIAYVLPGLHDFAIEYRSPNSGATNCTVDLAISVEAGRVYQLNATGFPVQRVCRLSQIPMASGAKVTYRNVAPGQAPPALLDQPVPYGLP